MAQPLGEHNPSEPAAASGSWNNWESFDPETGDDAIERADQPQALRVDTGHYGSITERLDDSIRHAIDLGASDIHIEPFEHEVRVRFRLDGVLRTVGQLATAHGRGLASRVKVLAQLDVAERRRPQDGRFRVDHKGRVIDLRVSVLPTAHGEKLVLRLLDRRGIEMDLEDLGFEPDTLDTFTSAITQPHGIILVTGPTGSGKTTTLYAALRQIATESLNITTVEDPVEYDVPGVNQTQARPDLGFGFAEALRAFLRQDPDVILVGEIRDGETARIAVRAALTGHLVFSTLHTNDAPSAPARLIDMGVEPYLLAAVLRLVVAQRLVRVLCPECKRELDQPPRVRMPDDPREAVAVGCQACRQTGYAGREAVYEVMPISDEMSNAIRQHASAVDLRQLAEKDGMRSLRVGTLAKINAGITTRDELLRIL